MAKKKYPTPQHVGRAGELFVAAELNRRGAAATLYLINTPRVDVVASSPGQSNTVNIQVKTKGPRSIVWQDDIERIKREARVAAETDFIVFVDLKSTDSAPDYYVCQMRKFAREHYRRHCEWIKSKGGSRPRNPHSTHTRVTMSQVQGGKDRWDILGVLPEFKSVEVA